MKAIAAQKGVTPSVLALAWVMSRGDFVVPLFGTKRRKYLEENIRAAEVTLTPHDLDEIDAAFPAGIAAGDRYPASARGSVNR